MNRKQTVLHLGRSKSPQQFKRGQYKNANQKQPSEGTTMLRQRSPINLNPHPNPLTQTLYTFGSQQSQESRKLFAKTHNGSFMGCQKQNDPGMSVQAENKFSSLTRGQRKGSASKQGITLGHASTQSVNEAARSIISQKEMQMGRKILLLESRIQQLHKQKQNCILKALQQNKRLVEHNNQLKTRLIYFMNKQSQLNQNDQQVKDFIKPIFVSIQGKPIALDSCLDQDDRTSIAFQLDENSRFKINTSRHESDPYHFQEMKNTQHQNQQIKTQLKQDSVNSNNLAQLQHENTKMKELIRTLENKNSQLLNQIQKLKEVALEQSQKRKKTSQFLQIIQDQSQYYVSKLLANTQTIMRKQDDIRLQKATAKQLQKKINQLEQKTKAESQSVSQAQNCKKCQNLVKALVKLNQKVYLTGAH